jgi:hypothetical protein
MNETDDNITIFFNEKNDDDNDYNDDLTKMMDKFRELELDIDDSVNNIWVDENSKCLIDYTVKESLTVKELLKICSYYDLDKNIKKYKKQDIIATIFYFESLPENNYIVQKRYMMWKNIHELLNDPIMKKYVIWK